MLYGLVRHIYIPKEVREPIQKGYVADELALTRDQETTTAKMEARLREAEQTVLLEAARITEGTKKLVAETKATGQKEAETIAAETEKKVAAIDQQCAEIDAQKTVALGEAENASKRMQQEAQRPIVRTGRQGLRRSDGLHQVAIRPGLARRHRFEDDIFRPGNVVDRPQRPDARVERQAAEAGGQMIGERWTTDDYRSWITLVVAGGCSDDHQSSGHGANLRRRPGAGRKARPHG